MSVTLKFYTERAAIARRDAAAASLDNVRDRHLCAAAAWDVLAARRARTNRMRVETDARKAAEREAGAEAQSAEADAAVAIA